MPEPLTPEERVPAIDAMTPQQREGFAWLGFNRDYLPPEAVEQLQGFLARLASPVAQEAATCPTCRGSGKNFWGETEDAWELPCRRCGGTGKVAAVAQEAAGERESRLLDAINWLMGCQGEFEPTEEDWMLFGGTKVLPPYWWRSEFRRRVGCLDYDRDAARYVWSAAPPRGGASAGEGQG